MDWTLLVVVLAVVAVGFALYVTRKPTSRPDDGVAVLHQRLDALTKIINDQLEASRQASERASMGVHRQVESFTQGMVQLQETVKQVQESVRSVSSFQEIFRSPKLRGNWGESSLQSALHEYFPSDRYEMQHLFQSGEIVDAVLKLPNNMILPIDSKFNWENFEKMTNASDETTRGEFRKLFLVDVKKKIDEIASKYLLPSEGTTDLALMYMPAEALYYEIINNIKDADIAAYARAKKVILVSPNTFFLTVSAILHWFRDVDFNRQTQDIMKRLGRVVTDAGKLADDFRLVGKHLTNARSAYDDTDKRLNLLVERTQRVIEMGEEDGKKTDTIGE